MIAYVVNPGSGSIKLACAEIQPSVHTKLPAAFHLDLQRVELTLEEAPDMTQVDELALKLLPLTVKWPRPDAIVGRGGNIGKVPAGTYRITDELIQHAQNVQAEYPDDPALNLGILLAQALGQSYDVPSFIVDPQSVDELLPEARMTGVRGVHRNLRFHALNAGAVARWTAHEVGKRFTEARVIVAHLGSTTSVTAFEHGHPIDTSGTGFNGGPMGARQAGPLSPQHLLEQAKQCEEIELVKRLTHDSGFYALTGTADLRELEQRLSHDSNVQQAVDGFIHQVCKAICEQMGALSGRPDAVALTGGIAHWDEIVNRIEDRLSWVAVMMVYPGEMEFEALAEGVGRVMLGWEGLRVWTASEVYTETASPLLLPKETPSASGSNNPNSQNDIDHHNADQAEHTTHATHTDRTDD